MAKKFKFDPDKKPGTVIYARRRENGELFVCSRPHYRKDRVDFRNWYLTGKGTYSPTKKGLLLKKSELEMLKEALDAVLEALEDE